MTGADLTRWTIWIATAAYFGRWICDFRPSAISIGRRSQTARLCWTVACAFLWIHVACAFHFHHHWSHADAVAHGAEQTRKVVGFAFGEGIWTNYLTMSLWLTDVAWWWLAPAAFSRRPKWIEIGWQSYLAFIGFNATVVFASGIIRWGTVAAFAIIAVCFFISRRTPSGEPAA